MAWNPSTPLTKPAVTAAELEQSSMDLWMEYLGGYFDGQDHAVDGVSLSFPLVTLSTQQGALEQPLPSAAISVTWLKNSKPNRRRIANKNVAFLRTSWTFYVRCGGSNEGDGGPKVRVKKVSDLLHALFLNKVSTSPLTRKGIRHVSATNQAVVAGADFATRKIIVSAELQYATETYA